MTSLCNEGMTEQFIVKKRARCTQALCSATIMHRVSLCQLGLEPTHAQRGNNEVGREHPAMRWRTVKPGSYDIGGHGFTPTWRRPHSFPTSHSAARAPAWVAF